jgi:peptidoglycan-associated lipoprotein
MKKFSAKTAPMWMMSLLLVVIFLIFGPVSCSKKPIQSDPLDPQLTDRSSTSLDYESARQKELDRQKEQALEVENLQDISSVSDDQEKEQITGPDSVFVPEMLEAGAKEFMDEIIFFPYDSSHLTDEAMALVKKKAEWLHNKAEFSVIIQGYTDERGTIEYNHALGERRSESIKKFFVDMGIAAERISTISYGEENPLDPGHSEAAWAKNRRAEFILKKN